MISIVAIVLCGIELSVAHMLDLSLWKYMTVGQVELVFLAIMGVLSDGSQRDRSVMMVFVVWFGWIAATDWYTFEINPLLVQYEAALFSAIVFWALARPYFYPSDEYKPGNVCIAFYKGTNAPFLSSLASLAGLPFASVAIVTGVTALRASGGGKMVVSDAKALLGHDFVLIDTGIQCTPPVIEAIKACVGKPTRSFGIFSTRCVANLFPVLKVIGYEPKSVFYNIPSIFYFQCVRKAHG